MTDRRPFLVLGGSGLLGSAVVEELSRRDVSFVAPTREALDLSDPDAAERAIAAFRPRAVVNAAAYTDVGRAESPAEREAVFALNRDAPAAVARSCADTGAALVHVSTDYVFDGSRSVPYVESDPPNPIQVYGESKLAGEVAVREAWPSAVVVRVSTLFGPARRGRKTYVDAVLDQVSSRPVVEVVETPVSSPTYAPDVAPVLLDLIEVGYSGVVHVVNEGGCSRLELARAIAEEAGFGRRCRVVGRPEPPSTPRRPRFTVLDTRALVGIFGHGLRPWSEALRDHLGGRRGEGT